MPNEVGGYEATNPCQEQKQKHIVPEWNLLFLGNRFQSIVERYLVTTFATK